MFIVELLFWIILGGIKNLMVKFILNIGIYLLYRNNKIVKLNKLIKVRWLLFIELYI